MPRVVTIARTLPPTLLLAGLAGALATLAGCGGGRVFSTHSFADARPPAAAVPSGIPAAGAERPSEPPVRPAAFQQESDEKPVEGDAGSGEEVGSETDGSPAVLPAPPPLPVAGNGGDAAAVPAEPAALTLAEVEAAAVANNPTLAGAAAALAKARGIYEQVGLGPNPTMGYVASEIGDGGTAGQQGVFASRTFVTADKLALNRAVESHEIEALRWRAEAQRLRVLGGVRRAFYAALGAQRRAELAGELVELAEAGVAAAEALVEIGEVARPDVLQVEIQLGEVRIAQRDAELDYEAGWRRLVALAGTPGRPVGRIAGDLDRFEPEERDFEALFAALLAASPELRAARARVERARAAVCRQRVQPVPNVLAQASLAYSFGGQEPLGGLQLGVPLPVFNDNRGNVAAAVADLHRALADAARLELDLRVRLADALRDLRRAENRVARLTDDVLPAAEENLDLTEEGYELGEFDLIRVFTARRSLFEASLARVDALTDLRTAAVVVDNLLLTDALGPIPDAGGDNLQGVGLRDLALDGE